MGSQCEEHFAGGPFSGPKFGAKRTPFFAHYPLVGPLEQCGRLCSASTSHLPPAKLAGRPDYALVETRDLSRPDLDYICTLPKSQVDVLNAGNIFAIGRPGSAQVDRLRRRIRHPIRY